jgi:hypothetical protein
LIEKNLIRDEAMCEIIYDGPLLGERVVCGWLSLHYSGLLLDVADVIVIIVEARELLHDAILDLLGLRGLMVNFPF